MNKEKPNQTPLVNANYFGQLLGLSKRQIFRLNSCGKIPAPVRIGGAVRWKFSDLFLCSHTHGGQICLTNGTPVVTSASVPRHRVKGR